jgi:hypothetical protein
MSTGYQGLFPGVKQLELKTDYLSSSSSDVARGRKP